VSLACDKHLCFSLTLTSVEKMVSEWKNNHTQHRQQQQSWPTWESTRLLVQTEDTLLAFSSELHRCYLPEVSLEKTCAVKNLWGAPFLAQDATSFPIRQPDVPGSALVFVTGRVGTARRHARSHAQRCRNTAKGAGHLGRGQGRISNLCRSSPSPARLGASPGLADVSRRWELPPGHREETSATANVVELLTFKSSLAWGLH